MNILFEYLFSQILAKYYRITFLLVVFNNASPLFGGSPNSKVQAVSLIVLAFFVFLTNNS